MEWMMIWVTSSSGSRSSIKHTSGIKEKERKKKSDVVSKLKGHKG
jgi:hypothetical protein